MGQGCYCTDKGWGIWCRLVGTLVQRAGPAWATALVGGSGQPRRKWKGCVGSVELGGEKETLGWPQ